VEDRVSFPLGVLRIPALRERGSKAFERHIARLIDEAGWEGRGRGLPFYLVGGSWRALARLDMTLADYPLPIIHHYELTPTDILRLSRTIPHLSKARLREVKGLSSSRAATLGDATALLSVLLKHLGSSTTVASAYGLREGLLYGGLDAKTRALDPLIVAAREEGRLLGRFPEHGDLLESWIAPLFSGEATAEVRLRHAACLLADVGWRANPEFRSERGVEIALHGNWVGIDAVGRAMLAQALHTSLGGGLDVPNPLAELASPAQLKLATSWGLAIRLGQRLSGGLAGPLERSGLVLDATTLGLAMRDEDRGFYGEAVERRHATLATAMGRNPVRLSRT